MTATSACCGLSSRNGASRVDRLSVIVTVYNRRDLLRRSMLSLASQSYTPHEVIVSDDGSDEDVLGVLRGCANDLGCRVTYVRQPDRGFRLAKCRNNGIRYAAGDVLVFLDQDIIGTKDYLAAFAESVIPGRFAVAYPVRLTEAQTRGLSEEMIATGCFRGIVTSRQRNKIRRQFLKDGFYSLTKRLIGWGSCRPKVRGGVFGVSRRDILDVDGFDENYRAWGNEDDDLGRRLYASGVRGYNPFLNDYPLHLYHKPYHDRGTRPNAPYAVKRMGEIRAGDVRAVRGVSRPRGNDPLEVARLA